MKKLILILAVVVSVLFVYFAATEQKVLTLITGFMTAGLVFTILMRGMKTPKWIIDIGPRMMIGMCVLSAPAIALIILMVAEKAYAGSIGSVLALTMLWGFVIYVSKK